MSSLSENLKKATAGFLAVLLIFLLPPALLAWDIGRVAFNPPLFKSLLQDEVVDSDLIPVSLEWSAAQVARDRNAASETLAWTKEPNVVEIMSLLDRKEWRAITEEVLPDEILTGWISTAVDDLYDWVDSEDPAPQIVLDMASFKTRLGSEHGVNALMIAYESLEPCSQDQLAEFAARLAEVPSGTQVLYTLCKFPTTYNGIEIGWYADQLTDFKNSVQAVLDKVPSKLELTNSFAQAGNGETSGSEGAKRLLRGIRSGMNLAWLLLIVPLVLILFLVVRSLKNLSTWWGIPLFVGGIFTLITGLVLSGLIRSMLSGAPMAGVPPLLDEIAVRIVIRLADAAIRPLFFQSVLLLLAVISLWTWLGISARLKKQAAA